MSVISGLLAKIAALFMSLITFITGLFGGVLVPNVDGYVALENTSISISNGKYMIINSYDEFIEAVGESKDETEKYDEEYFEAKSLLAFNVTLPQTNYYVVCDSIDEAGDTVTVRYHLKNDGSFGLTMISSQSVIVEIEKDISELVLFEGTKLIYDSTAEPKPVNCTTHIGNDLYFVDTNKEVTIVHSYEDWQNLRTSDYKNLFDEAYFENGSVVVISVLISDLNFEPVVKSATEANGILDITYDVNLLIPRVLSGVRTGSLIFVETSKDIETVNITDTVIERPFYNHTKTLDPAAIATDEKDGNVTFIRNYDEYVKAVPQSTFRSAYYDNDFFEKFSLVLVTTALPNENYYISYSYDNIYENGNTLELNYNVLKGNYNASDELINYSSLLVEINKNITCVNINETSDKPHFYFYDAEAFTLPDSFENTVISDFESWSEIYSGTDSVLAKYDEEYFANKSLAAVAVALPDTNKKVRLRNFIENGNTLEVDSRISESDTPNALNQIIIIEVSKNITEISNEIKSLANKVTISSYYYLSSIYGEEPILISSYDEFIDIIGDMPMKPQYDETFFEENSLVLTEILLHSSIHMPKSDYAYENAETLELGFIDYELGGIGFAALMYQTALVEVSKDIETVNVSYIENF